MDVFGSSQIFRQVCYRETEDYAPDERQDFKADFSLNENPLGCTEQVFQAIEDLDRSRIVDYQPVDRELNRLIADFEGVKPDNVLVSAGSDKCLQLLSTALFFNNRRIAYPKPSFPRYAFYINRMNCRKEPFSIPVYGDRDLGDMISQTEKADILILDNPSNPTGAKFSMKEVKELVDRSESRIILDMALDDGTGSLENLLDPDLFMVKSFSKYFGLAGLRIGYIISTEQNISRLQNLVSPFEVDYVAQEAAKEALRNTEHLEKSSKYISDQRQTLRQELEQRDIRHSPSRTTNMVVQMPAQAQEELQERGINLTRGKDYPGLPEDAVRLGIRTQKENNLLIQELDNLRD